jgi:hypothetical protein
VIIAVTGEMLAGLESGAGDWGLVACGDEDGAPPCGPPPGFSLDFPDNLPLIFKINPMMSV